MDGRRCRRTEEGEGIKKREKEEEDDDEYETEGGKERSGKRILAGMLHENSTVAP